MDTSKGELTLHEVDREAKVCAEIVGRSLGAYLKTVGLVSETYLAQVLVALWDSGIHEYLRGRGRIEIGAASRDLNPDPVALGANPPRTYAQLDYSFIHPISRQGPLRTVKEWEEIIKSAGATLVERVPGFAQVPGWISLYIVDLA